jgi:hypothetical protein
MPTFNTGRHPETSIEEQQGGMQICRSMTMKSNTFQEKRMYWQMYYHDHQAWTKGRKTINKSRYYPLTASST